MQPCLLAVLLVKAAAAEPHSQAPHTEPRRFPFAKGTTGRVHDLSKGLSTRLRRLPLESAHWSTGALPWTGARGTFRPAVTQEQPFGTPGHHYLCSTPKLYTPLPLQDPQVVMKGSKTAKLRCLIVYEWCLLLHHLSLECNNEQEW